MKKHFWQGRLILDSELHSRVANINADILKGHAVSFNIDEFYRACERFAKRLVADKSLREHLIRILVESKEANELDAEVAIQEILSFLRENSLRAKMNSEFGTDNPFRSQKVSKTNPIFESWFPLGFLVQFLASNSPSLAVLSAFEGLLTGNINFIKLSKNSSDFSVRFFEEFFKDEVAKNWQDLLIVAKISSGEKGLLEQVSKEADAVVAWGSEESISEIKKITPARARFIEWGHRISFAYITDKKLSDPKIYEQLAHDVFLFDQQSCSSPQCIFIEDADFSKLREVAGKLKQAFDVRAQKETLNQPTDLEFAEINRTVLVTETESALHENYTGVIEDHGQQWRILIDIRSGLRASPLYRSVWLKPLKRNQILETLRPLSQYLQTVGLGCERDELFELSQNFYKAGATRIRPVGEMLESYAGEPHDGVSALTRYMKKVSLEQRCGVELYATLDDLKRTDVKLAPGPIRLMTKEDFQNMVPPRDSEELFFKSGGSSGEPKISVFTYLDYHRQMKFAADGLLAAGLDPDKDRCMNLFFSGGLYGSFLSIFSVLEDLKAVQFPMTAHMDFDFVGQMIVSHKANVLMGMPSYLMQLFESKAPLFKKNPVVKKIFFGGEAFNKKQIERLKNEFGIESIISATYGSVDMGPLGYQCAESPQGVHHLHQTLHHLEIIDLEQDKPVARGNPGRMIFSSYGRQGLNLLRYDIGDLGAWVDDPCPCGRLAPRFQLLGRHGDIFRAAGLFLNYNKFSQILVNDLSYAHEFQIIVDKVKNLDRLEVVVDSLVASSEIFKKTLLEKYVDLHELIHTENSLIFEVKAVDKSQFIRSPGSGKLLRIIDRRRG